MNEIAPALTAEENKFFETGGEVAPAVVETPVEQVEQPTEQVVEKAPEVKADEPEADEKATWSPERLRNEFDQRRAALKEERSRRKGLETERQQLREELAKYKGIAEATQKPAAPIQKPALPDIENPIEELQDLKQWKQQQESERQEKAKQDQFAAQHTAFENAIVTNEQTFAKANPDYYEAVEFAKQERHKELEAMGFSDEAHRDRIITNDILSYAAARLQQGQNPAEGYYSYAKARGYKKTEPKPEAKPDKLDTIKQGQNAAKSLGNASGGAKPQMSIQTLLEMSEDEQVETLLDDKAWRRLAGAA